MKARSLPIVVSVAVTFVFALSLMLFLGISQFTDAVRAAIVVRLGIAAGDVATSLQDAARVGVTIQDSAPIVAQLREAQASDPIIATIALRDSTNATLAQVGDASQASNDPGLASEQAVVSDFGVTLARVQVRASAAEYRKSIQEAAYALLFPALLTVVIGVTATSAALIALVAFFHRREERHRAVLIPLVRRRMTEAGSALDGVEVLLQ